jgi:membrane-associated phospholipid phosphatase
MLLNAVRGGRFMKHKIILLGLLLSDFANLQADLQNNSQNDLQSKFAPEQSQAAFFLDIQGLLHNFLKDLIAVNKQVYTSVDTLKILTWFLPVYLLARYSDDTIHASFYDAALHQNINQMSSAAHKLANSGVTALTVFLALLPIVPGINQELYRTSSMFGKGVVSLAVLRTFLKNTLKARSSCRPWHQSYSNKQRALGGFPSGHMAFAGYMTSLFGLRHGPWWGLPLSIFTAFSFFASVNCNRHYTSQLVGGLSLGVVYGWGSYQLLNSRYGESLDISLDLDRKSRPSIGISYEF